MRRHCGPRRRRSVTLMPDEPKSKRVETGLIFGGVIVLMAVSGYFVGLRQTNSAISMTRAVSVGEGGHAPRSHGCQGCASGCALH